jgi:flagellar M-ring protein FliF
MGFLNNAINQFNNTFRTLSLGARVVAGLLLLVVVISLAYLFNRQTSAPDAFLFGGEPVTAAELPNIEAAFGKSSLKNYTIEGNRIRVPRGEESTYMAALAEDNAMPSTYGSHLRDALNTNGVFDSKDKQAQRLKYGKEMELAQIISKMQGIGKASVLFDFREEGGLNRRKIYSASVSVETVGSLPLDEMRVQSIRQLIAGAFAGMTPESVAVIDLKHNRSFAQGRPGEMLSGTQDPMYQTKIAYESEWTRKVQNALSYVPGAVVTCDVHLNSELEILDRKLMLDSKTVLTHQSETADTSSQTLPGNSGRPGASAQGGFTNQAASLNQTVVTPSGRTEKESTAVNNKFATPGSETTTRRAGLTPKRVTVTVGVPYSYYEKIWKERNPAVNGQAKTATPTEMEQLVKGEGEMLRAYIAKLLPLRDIENPDKSPITDVVINTFQQITSPELPETQFSETALAWAKSNSSTIATGIFALIGLMMLRGLLKGIPTPAPAESETPAISQAATAAVNSGEATTTPTEAVVPAKRLARRAKGTGNLRDELVEIVREDPDTAANIIRSWITSPG